MEQVAAIGYWSIEGPLILLPCAVCFCVVHTHVDGGQHEDLRAGGGLLKSGRDPHGQLQRWKLEDESTHVREGGAKLDEVVGYILGQEVRGGCTND